MISTPTTNSVHPEEKKCLKIPLGETIPPRQKGRRKRKAKRKNLKPKKDPKRRRNQNRASHVEEKEKVATLSAQTQKLIVETAS